MYYGYSVPDRDAFGLGDIPKHKTFISYYHKSDQWSKDHLVSLYGKDHFVDNSVSDGDIDDSLKTDTIWTKIRDEFIANATVTVVLVGNGTWRRKYVDWEIASSIRDTKNNSRTGLIGVLTPFYSIGYNCVNENMKFSEDNTVYNKSTIPPRLWDNIESGFAKIYSWNYFTNGANLARIIDDAYKRRYEVQPDNSRDAYEYNKSDFAEHW